MNKELIYLWFERRLFLRENNIFTLIAEEPLELEDFQKKCEEYHCNGLSVSINIYCYNVSTHHWE